MRPALHLIGSPADSNTMRWKAASDQLRPNNENSGNLEDAAEGCPKNNYPVIWKILGLFSSRISREINHP